MSPEDQPARPYFRYHAESPVNMRYEARSLGSEAVFHPVISWSNPEWKNMYCILVTLETSHLERSWLNSFPISMSSDGTRVAIGASENDGSSGSGSAAGHVRVYSESGGTWTQVGGDIDGEAAGDWSGVSVSMSSDGTRVAIGASWNDGTSGSTSDNRGHVRVYSESGGTWTQVGGDIDGEAAGDAAGRTVSMSADGTRVAIGATENDANRGHVRVYSESGGTWTQIGGDIDGEDALDNSGVSISMSPDGTRVAIGATQNDGSSGSDSYAGHVRVYTPFCDASTAPTNGVVGTCTNSLASGSTCQPTCDSGYTVSGTSSCTAGTLTAATCAASPSSPAAGGSETPAADLVLDSTPGEYGASVVLGASPTRTPHCLIPDSPATSPYPPTQIRPTDRRPPCTSPSRWSSACASCSSFSSTAGTPRE
jgi:hypothetical protein